MAEKTATENKKFLLNLCVFDKITLLNEIKKNFDLYEHYWTNDKVDWLSEQVKTEVQKLSNFKIK